MIAHVVEVLDGIAKVIAANGEEIAAKVADLSRCADQLAEVCAFGMPFRAQ